MKLVLRKLSSSFSAAPVKLPVFPLQDQLAADMYSFFSKEGDYARYFVTVSMSVCQQCVCMSFCGNIRSCRLDGELASNFIFSAVMYFTAFPFFNYHPFLSVSVAPRSSS